jgi:hypothetical protein
MVFVTIDGIQGNFMCRAATATTDIPLGVSQVGTDLAPNLIQTLAYPQSITYTAAAGEPGAQIQIFTSGDVAPVRLGAGGCTPGAIMTNDATVGLAVTVTQFTASRYMGGVALQAGSAGEIVEIYLLTGRA